MLIDGDQKHSLHSLFHLIRLRGTHPGSGNSEKVEQILAYLEVIHAQVRKTSSKRKLVFIDCAAGNSYLSFLTYHFYNNLQNRGITIHCIDNNERLVEKSKGIARTLGFDGMHFHAGDILELPDLPRVDVAYSLHACDSATDKALFVGLKVQARCILSVSCCQHSVRKSFKNNAVKGVTRYKAFKDRLVYMVADTMRAHLIATFGYKVDVFEFTSARCTDKNTMIRARRSCTHGSRQLIDEYENLRLGFNVEPELARLVRHRSKGRTPRNL